MDRKRSSEGRKQRKKMYKRKRRNRKKSNEKRRMKKRGMKKKDNEKLKKNKSNRVRTTDAFSGELPAYLSLNRLLNGILSYSYSYFVQIQPISQKFNSCVTDGPTDRPAHRRTHPLIEMRERI